jgi:DNA repair ATPase RecN
MSGMATWKAKIELDIKDLQKQLIDADEKFDKFANEDRKVKLDIDTKTLESAIQKLNKMLDSLSKGTGDFKQFENLSKELSSIVSEVQNLSKAFGKVDDSGAKTLLSSIQNIDKSLSELSQNILNVNKNMNNMGGNTSGAVKQVENIGNAYQNAAKEAEKLADAQSKLGQKTNISSGMKDTFPKTSENLEQVAQSEQKIQQEARAIQSKWEQAEKAIQNYMNAVTKLNNLKASDKSTGKKSYEIVGQIEEIEKLKKEAYDARQVLSSMINPQNVDTDTWKRYVDVINRLDQASNGSAESVNRLKDSLKNTLNSELNSLQNSIDKYQNIITQAQTYPSDFHPSTEYNTKLANLESANNVLKNYKSSLQGVNELTKEQQAEINKLTQNCEKAATEFKKLSAAEKGTVEVGIEKAIQRINKDLAENTKYSAEAKAGFNVLLEQLKSGDPSINLRKITEEIIKIENAEIAAGRAGKSLWDIFKTKSTYGFIGQMQSYLSMYVGFYGMVNGVKKAVSTITELDTALVDLKKTTAMNENQLENFYYDSNNVAKQMGVTTQEIIDQASAWSRLGFSTNEAATEMAKLSSQFASISPGMSVDESQSGLVSIMKAWSINPDQVKSEIMDPINKLGKLLPKHTVMYGAIKYSIVDNYIG